MTTKPPLPLAPLQQPPLLLTIRFSAAIPDVDLDIPHPGRTTVVSLKNLIRTRLTEPNSQRRLRFLYRGKILPDPSVLTSVLHIPVPPPPPINTNLGGGGGKGKSIPGRPTPPQRIYINCSIGDSLTTSELEAEAEAAAKPPPSTTPSSTTTTNNKSSSPENKDQNSSSSPSSTQDATNSAAANANNDTTPRGFDRLLSTGFTPSEVNQLRLQFRSIHSSRYTPDTLPSPDSFRRMEDSWIDDNNSTIPSTTATATATNGGGGGADTDEVGIAATVDVLVRGVVVGFLWPMGSAGWLLREEGMASGRWRWMVGVGVVFAFLIGVIRGISGER